MPIWSKLFFWARCNNAKCSFWVKCSLKQSVRQPSAYCEFFRTVDIYKGVSFSNKYQKITERINHCLSTHTCYKVMINIFCVRSRTSIGLTTCQLIEKRLQVLKMMMKNVASWNNLALNPFWYFVIFKRKRRLCKNTTRSRFAMKFHCAMIELD